MGKIYNQAQMESILKIYFSQEREELLTQDSLDMINGFLEFCKVKDVINNSDTVSLIKQLYGAEKDSLDKDDGVFMSAASRFRFKKNIFELFKKYLSNKYAS